MLLVFVNKLAILIDGNPIQISIQALSIECWRTLVRTAKTMASLIGHVRGISKKRKMLRFSYRLGRHNRANHYYIAPALKIKAKTLNLGPRAVYRLS